MTFARRLLALPLILGLHCAAAPFSDQIPEDALLIFQVNHHPKTAAAFAASPLGKSLKGYDWMGLVMPFVESAWKEQKESVDDEEVTEDLKTGIEPTLFKREIEKAGTRYKDFASHLSGQTVVVFGDMSEMIELSIANKPIREKLYEDIDLELDEDPAYEIAARKELEIDAREEQLGVKNMLFMAEVNDGDALLAKLAAWAAESLQEQTDGEDPMTLSQLQWNGLKVYTFVTTLDEDASDDEKALAALESNPWWTVSNGVLILTLSETGLRNAIERQSTPPVKSLAALPAFGDALTHAGAHDGLFFINLPRIDALLRPVMASETAQIEDNGQAPFTPVKLLEWMALDSLLPYTITFRMADEGIHTRARMGFSRESTLSRLMIDPTDTPAPRPLFAHKNAMQISSGHWSLPRFYEALERELAALSPQIPAALGMGRAIAAGQLGFDIKLQFLDHLGSGIVFIQDIDTAVLNKMLDLAKEEDQEALMEHTRLNPTNGQNYLIGIEVKNQDAVTSALNTLVGKAHPNGLPAPEMYKGQALNFPIPDMGDMPNRLVSYTILEDYLLLSIGNPALLRQAVDASQDIDSRIWSTPDFLRMEPHTLPGGQFLEYSSRRAQEAGAAILKRSLGMMMDVATQTQMPDISPIVKSFQQAIGSTIRKGLVFEVNGFIEYGKAP